MLHVIDLWSCLWKSCQVAVVLDGWRLICHTAMRRIQRVDVSKTESMAVLAEHLFCDTLHDWPVCTVQGDVTLPVWILLHLVWVTQVWETQMVGTNHWIFFLDVMNGRSRKRSRTWSMEVKQKHVEEWNFAIRLLHRSLCFHSYKSRHIHFWTISLFSV